MVDLPLLAFQLECECCSKRADLLHDVLAASDEAVAKALMVSEVAQIARGEQRIRLHLLEKWRIRSEQAAATAERIIAGGGKIPSALRAVDKAMARWHGDVAERYKQHLGQAYRLARIAGHKKGTGQTKAPLAYYVPNFTAQLQSDVKKAKVKGPVFDLVDKAAIETLEEQNVIWLGDLYTEGVAPVVREAVRPALIAGLGRAEAGKMVRQAVAEKLDKFTSPGGWNGTAAKYFEGVAANSTTQARVSGQLRSFSQLKITRYEIMNPMDDRTSIICTFMNGKVFEIKDGLDQVANDSKAKNPDGLRASHPWLGITAIKGIAARGGTKALAEAGLALPPYHFRCRSTVDISETTSYRDLDD